MNEQMPAPPQEEQKQGLLGRATGAAKSGIQKGKQASAERSAAREAEAAALQAAHVQQQQDMIAKGYDLFEYRVITLRETLIGDKINHAAMEKTLNEWAAQGWHVRSITSASVTGRVGAGGVSGLIVVLERPIKS